MAVSLDKVIYERFQELHEALLSAYPDVESLRRMLQTKLGYKLDHITSGNTEERVFELINRANAEGWLTQLLQGAVAANPNNTELRRFVDQLPCLVIDGRRPICISNADSLPRRKLLGSSALTLCSFVAGALTQFGTGRQYNSNTHVTELSLAKLLTGRELDAILKRAQSNVQIVGITDGYIRTNHLESMSNATVRGIDIWSYLYLPYATTNEALETYLRTVDRYRPNANSSIEALKTMWETQDVELRSAGGATVVANNAHYKLLFYDDRPTGWATFLDVSSDYLSATEIYWFPYLNTARNMDRSGIHVMPGALMYDELLMWLKGLTLRSRAADQATISWWRSQVMKQKGA